MSESCAANCGYLSLNFIEAKNLKGSLIGKRDPYLIVKYAGQKYKSPVHKNGGKTPQWNWIAHLRVSEKEIESGEDVEVTIYDEDIGIDDRIGSVRIDVGSYMQELRNSQSWVSLDKGNGEIHVAGIFNYDAAVFLNFVAAKDLKGCVIGKRDPYLTIKYKDQKFRTETAKKGGRYPTWHYEIRLDISKQDVDEVVHITVLDENIGIDDKMGLLELPVNMLIQGDKDAQYDLTKGKGRLHIRSRYLEPRKNAGAAKAKKLPTPRLTPRSEAAKMAAATPAAKQHQQKEPPPMAKMMSGRLQAQQPLSPNDNPFAMGPPPMYSTVPSPPPDGFVYGYVQPPPPGYAMYPGMGVQGPAPPGFMYGGMDGVPPPGNYAAMQGMAPMAPPGAYMGGGAMPPNGAIMPSNMPPQ